MPAAVKYSGLSRSKLYELLSEGKIRRRIHIELCSAYPLQGLFSLVHKRLAALQTTKLTFRAPKPTNSSKSGLSEQVGFAAGRTLLVLFPIGILVVPIGWNASAGADWYYDGETADV
jgi:hypothetical protein